MKKLLIISLSLTVLFSLLIYKPGETFAAASFPAPISGHYHYAVKGVEEVYVHPSETNNAAMILGMGVLSLVPSLGVTAVKVLGYLSIAGSIITFTNPYKEPVKYTVVHHVYRSYTPTANYYGYYVITIYNHKTGRTEWSKRMPIAKTAY